MKKVWYLEGKENKKKKTVKLFVYEKEKIPTAHLDLSAFAEFAQYDNWIIRFFHKDAPVFKEIIYQKDSEFLKEALSGKGIMDADTAALLQRNRKELELCIRVGKFCFVSGGVECPLPESDQREEKREKSDTDNGLEQSEEQKTVVEPVQPIERQNSREAKEQPEQENSRELEGTAEQQNSRELEYDSLDEPDADDEPEEIQSGFRKIIELGVLEEEMLFRSYLHNSFLLHGYYNYGHLVLDERNGKSRLGVPGNYYEREQMVATMFGFPDFEPAGKEKVQTGTFGYYFTKG